MSDRDTFDRRLRAVERTLTGEDHDLETLQETGELAQRVETLESSLVEAESRIAELEAATQALRGYAGNIRSVNEDVEQRADAALVAVDRLQRQVDGGMSGIDAPEPRQPRRGRRGGVTSSNEAGPQDGAEERRSGQRTATEQRSGNGTEPSSNSGADENGGLTARLRAVF